MPKILFGKTFAFGQLYLVGIFSKDILEHILIKIKTQMIIYDNFSAMSTMFSEEGRHGGSVNKNKYK